MVVLFVIRCARKWRAGMPWCSIWVPLLILGGPVLHPWLSLRSPNLRAQPEVSALFKTRKSSAPPGELGSVLGDVLWPVLFLCQKHGRNARILLPRVDVIDSFRQVPGGLCRFVCLWVRGWRSRGCGPTVATRVVEQPRGLGVGSVGAGTFPHTLYVSKFSDIPATVEYRRARRTRPPRGGSAVPFLGDCQPVPGTGGNAGRYPFVRY